jgi:hypothetical protein
LALPFVGEIHVVERAIEAWVKEDSALKWQI